MLFDSIYYQNILKSSVIINLVDIITIYQNIYLSLMTKWNMNK